MRAAAAVGALSVLIYAPLHAVLFGFERMVAAGLWENLLQIVAQGMLSGVFAIFLFARSVTLLGAGRAAVFPALVPGFRAGDRLRDASARCRPPCSSSASPS